MDKINKINILKRLRNGFITEDKREPFIDRNYVEETIRIYDNLIESNTCEYQEKAIYDIISDIFRYLSVDGWDK